MRCSRPIGRATPSRYGIWTPRNENRRGCATSGIAKTLGSMHEDLVSLIGHAIHRLHFGNNDGKLYCSSFDCLLFCVYVKLQ